MFAVTQRCGSITPFGSAVLPLVNCRIASESGSVAGDLESVRGRVRPQLPRTWWRRCRPGRNRRAPGRRGSWWPRRWRCAGGSRRRTRRSNRAASAAGSIATVAPASQVAWIAVTSSRDVGPRMPDGVAGPDPARLERGGHAPGVVVELGPTDGVGRVARPVGGAGDEGDAAAPIGRGLDTRAQGRWRGRMARCERRSSGLLRLSDVRPRLRLGRGNRADCSEHEPRRGGGDQ